jgi:2-keto-4-pentenoate hydratase/2-oxohepta-3-ene-1,7-dioic acid hydratase in catechol pathway
MHWLRFVHAGKPAFGVLEGEHVHVHEGDMFAGNRRSATTLEASSLEWLTPCEPSKFICLWNNFHASAAKQGLTLPTEPLWVIKARSACLAHRQPVVAPGADAYDGRVVYEGELGVVIGRRCRDVSEREAEQAIFGYTCVNDITAIELIGRDPAFPQWTRAKSFDTFGPFGPVIATGLDPMSLTVRTLVGGRERQNYPVSDIVFSPARIVSLLSREMTLEAGDLIACGTSVGVLPIRPGATLEVVIDGIGVLSNQYVS